MNRRVAIVDAGPLYASVDTANSDNERSVAALRTPGLRLLIPTMVVAEVSYLIGRSLGPDVDARFLEGIEVVDVVPPQSGDWTRIAELVGTYRDFPLGGADTSVIVVAERLNTDLVLTLDRRHFAAVRPQHASTFRIFPE